MCIDSRNLTFQPVGTNATATPLISGGFAWNQVTLGISMVLRCQPSGLVLLVCFPALIMGIGSSSCHGDAPWTQILYFCTLGATWMCSRYRPPPRFNSPVQTTRAMSGAFRRTQTVAPATCVGQGPLSPPAAYSVMDHVCSPGSAGHLFCRVVSDRKKKMGVVGKETTKAALGRASFTSSACAET